MKKLLSALLVIAFANSAFGIESFSEKKEALDMHKKEFNQKSEKREIASTPKDKEEVKFDFTNINEYRTERTLLK